MSAIESSVELITNPENKDPQKLIENLEEYRKKITTAAMNPSYAAPLFILYAVKGKLGMIERILLGAIGVATLAYVFRENKMVKQITESVDINFTNEE